MDRSYKILNDLSKISKKIIVKDHFEHGYFKTTFKMLIFMPIMPTGKIPKKYFDNESWQNQIKNKL